MEGSPVAAPRTVGVVGAGTMGSGIAQLAAQYGARTLVHDPVPDAAQRGIDRARAGIEKVASKGRLDGDPAQAAALLEDAGSLEELESCELIVEAAPESLAVKHELFASLSQVAPQAVLASNTSSIPITAIASAAADPSRVVGLHFFNPAPLMRLVEVVAGLQSAPGALELARATGRAMGKRVIDAADVAGFLVNRCNRPFGLEALRLLQERLADVETIDRIVRAAGFRMGPFELQDLVGIDVGFEVSKSFHELGFGEPRWRPSPLSARMVAAGRHGRKSGRGWYEYPEGEPYRAEDPPAPAAGGGEGLVVVAGHLGIADELRDAAVAAGWDVAEEPDGEVPWLIVDCGSGGHEEEPLQGAPQLLLCAEASLHQLDPSGGAAGFHVLPPLEGTNVVELTRSPTTTALAVQRAERFVATLGKHAVWVGDAPGLVLGRLACQVINESAFALGEGIGDAADIDDGMVLGLNHPRGPLAWADRIGLDHVLLVLEALREEYGEERYRAAPLLRRMVADGRLGELTGAGFHEHDGGT